MYYNTSTWANTNLDKSHMQGLELQNLYKVNPKLSTNVNYAYTDAVIDEEADNTLMNGKTNPMTSKHNISASVIYTFSDIIISLYITIIVDKNGLQEVNRKTN